jgi:anti-sigma factor RsiW
MSCDRFSQVHAYHDGQLGPAEKATLESHFAECAECAELLRELRGVTRLIAAGSLPDVTTPTSRYYQAWNLARQRRSVLRISGWLTGAAAAVLVGSLVLWPRASTTETAQANIAAWEVAALMPPPDQRGDRPDELIELAQWLSDDLSAEGVQ